MSGIKIQINPFDLRSSWFTFLFITSKRSVLLHYKTKGYWTSITFLKKWIIQKVVPKRGPEVYTYTLDDLALNRAIFSLHDLWTKEPVSLKLCSLTLFKILNDCNNIQCLFLSILSALNQLLFWDYDQCITFMNSWKKSNDRVSEFFFYRYVDITL